MISNIKCWPSKGNSSIRANGSFQVDNFIIKFLLIEGKKGLFVSLPSHKYEKEGKTEYVDDVFPLSKEARDEMQKDIIGAYNKEIKTDQSMNQDQSYDNIPFG